MTRSRCLLAALLVLVACGRSRRQPLPDTSQVLEIKDAGFSTPESVLHDPDSDLYFVANINGNPGAADDNGFISVLSPEGKVLRPKWIDGAADSVTLNAPKGMTVVGDRLYVMDINTVRWFDRRTGAPRGSFEVPGATFLNDVAASVDGSVYFTDSGLKAGASGLEPSGTDAVYRLSYDGVLDTLMRGESLGHPNGIAVTGDSVWVVGYGSGEMYRLEKGARVDVVKLPKGGLDGLVVFAGDAFVSSWEAEAVYRGKLGGPFQEAITGLPAPADIGHDLWRNRILVPLFNANEVRVYPLAF